MPEDPFAAIAEPAQQQADPFASIVEKPETPPPPKKPGFWDKYDAKVAPLITPTQHNYKSLLPKNGRYDPKAYGHEAVTALSNIGAGGLGAILHPVNTVGGILKSAVEMTPPVALAETLMGKKTPGQEIAEQFVENPAETAETMIGQTAVLDAAGRGAVETAKAPAKIGAALRGRYGPKNIPVGDETVPVMVGEAKPESSAGRLQTNLKRSGASSERFEKVENKQQQAVKDVIRKTAQKTSGQIGPLQSEPSDVVNDAATASYAKATPLYEELDKSLTQVPDALQNVSRITQDAINKARKLGVDVGEGVDLTKITPEKDGTINWGGTKISKATHPERWDKLVQDGIIDDSGGATPLKAYRQVRSQLIKMQRASADAGVRFAIGKDIETMTRNIESAIKDTPIEKNFSEANRLWSKGKALQDVSEAVRDATKGTPAQAQAPGISSVPTELQGASLVKKMNELYENGTLERAFTHDEIANLRQSADILDRIQRTPVGKGSGESITGARGLTHALRGNKGPLIGGAIGGAAGFLAGHPFYGAEAGASLGFILQKVGEQGLARVMTRVDGVNALEALEKAKTPAETKAAINKIAAIAGASQPKKRVAAALSGPGGRDEFMAIPNPKGMVEKGNLPIWNRPTVQNADGSHSSEYSTSFEDEKGREVLVPTIVNGKFLTPDGKKPEEGSAAEKAMFKAAWDHYLKTGENLGKFDNSDDADAYAEVLHNRGNQ